jgi:hypothetical protein
MTSPSEIATEQQMVPEDDQNMPELTWNPTDAMPAGDPQPPEPIEPANPGFTAVDSAAEPVVVGAIAEPVVVGPAEPWRSLAVPVLRVEPGSTQESPVASDRAPGSTRWHEIQALFVDDPRSSTELAASLVDDSVELLIVSLKEQQQSMLSAWQGDDARTEEMRTAVQRYRTFWNRLEDFSREA